MSTLDHQEYVIHMPAAGADGLDQHEEYCEVEWDGERRRIRFHDYDEIFKVPGLYERLFADALSCDSPRVVVDLLHDALRQEDERPQDLQVLDFGAGNGMVGAELARIDSGAIVGVDLLEAAKEAAERDRPGVYDAYHALDMTELAPSAREELEQHDFNCLTCVAALGFGDVPPEAFASAFELVADEGWVAFNIRERFVEEADTSGFSRTLATALEEGTIVEHARVTYTHRLSVSGDPLPYVALVGRKQGELELVA
ncbi:class I SAM-dependent DNA methyltransferase [Conexibacter arvalis]|uniref:SAM-dependent methyltransferase n=1 Tax=Conexibacter arvalis TaxID=912552 RepID=A0A840I9A5_9ACTN|nr:class I SAM-dependent methyltransferase [Conexibacter arvalis]MBB4660895.1 SAM-dependent methyltransferase [Conexibacter arvalis]